MPGEPGKWFNVAVMIVIMTILRAHPISISMWPHQAFDVIINVATFSVI